MIREYRLIVGSATDIKIKPERIGYENSFSVNERYEKDCIE